MADVKKTKLNDENLDQIVGGTMSAEDLKICKKSIGNLSHAGEIKALRELSKMSNDTTHQYTAEDFEKRIMELDIK